MNSYSVIVQGLNIFRSPRTMETLPKSFVEVRLLTRTRVDIVDSLSGIRETASVIFTNFASVKITCGSTAVLMCACIGHDTRFDSSPRGCLEKVRPRPRPVSHGALTLTA